MDVIVVDDEPIIRTGLRTLVDWEENGFRLAGEAQDGVEALELLKRSGADIIITDLLMPRMDGLELMREIRRSSSDCGVLVLSCMDDFSYVKEAMKLGAYDYLLKPTMEPEQLVGILKDMRASLKLSREERSRMDRLKQDLELTKKHNLSGRTLAYIKGQSEDKELAGELFAEKKNVFGLFVACTGAGAPIPETDGSGLLANVEWSSHERLLLFPCENGLSEATCFSVRRGKAAEIAAAMKFMSADGMEAVDFYVGIGPKIRKVEDLRRFPEWISRTRQHRFYGLPESIVGDPETAPARDVLPTDCRSDLLRTFANGSLEGVRHHGERISTAIRENRPPADKVHGFVYEMLRAASGIVRDKGIPIPEAMELKIPQTGDLGVFLHLDALLAWMSETLTDLLRLYGSGVHYASDNPFVRKALSYMQEHYRSNIGTVDIADSVKLSRSYLSDLFSRETGASLSEALTQIRIRQAKHLLQSGEMKIYEVAQEVGFQDAKRFAKTFRRIVGSSPRDFEGQSR